MALLGLPLSARIALARPALPVSSRELPDVGAASGELPSQAAEDSGPTTGSARPLLEASAPRPRLLSSWNPNAVPTSALLCVLAAAIAANVGWATLESMAAVVLRDHSGASADTLGLVFLACGLLSVACVAALTVWLWATESSGRSPGSYEYAVATAGLLGVSLGFVLLVDWRDLGGDACAKFSCSFTPDAVCPLNQTRLPCLGAPACAWNQNTAFGPCRSCAPVCHNADGARAFLWQTAAGMALLTVCFPLVRLSCGAMWALLHAGPKSALMQHLLVSTGAAARILSPLISLSVYRASGSRTWLVFAAPALFCAGAWVALVRIRQPLRRLLWAA
jgi:hypothetical protein